MLKSSLILFISLLMANVRLSPAGVAAAVDNVLVMNAKNYGIPILMKSFSDIKVPRIDFDGGNVDNIEVQFAI